MDLSRFSNEQKEAILSGSSRLILRASAGSGKTTVLSHRVVHQIIENNIESSGILVITFTTKATAELKKRILELLKLYKGEVLDLPYIANFNTFGNSIVRDHFTLFGFSDIPVLITDERRAAFEQEYFGTARLPDLRDTDGAPFKSDRIKEIFSNLLNACQSANIGKKEIVEYLDQLGKNKENLPDPVKQEIYEKFGGQNARTLGDFITYYDKYTEYKRNNNLIDYADQINLAYNLLSENDTVLSYYRSKFRHIFVDEYQDTSLVQSQLIELLANDASLTIVGDANQSIYEWRQAEPSNIVNIGGDSLYLSTNYRSVDLIVHLGNRFRLYDRANEANAHKKNSEHPVDVSLYQVRQEDESEFIAASILKSINNGVSPKDIAILLRGRTGLDALTKAFDRYGIPYAEYSSEDTQTQNVALRLLEELAVIFENKAANNLNWVFVLEHLCGLRPHEMASLRLKDNNNSIAQILGKLDDAGYSDRLTYLYQLYERYLDSSIQDFALSCKKIFMDMGMLRDRGDIIRYDNAILDIATVDELLEKGIRSARVDDMEADKVQILTIHSSKGLEFDTVFVPYIRKDSFPSRNRELPSNKQVRHQHLPEELSQKRYYDEASGRFVPIPTLYTILSHGINDPDDPLNIHAYAGKKNAAINENKISQAYNYYHMQNKLDEERRLLYVAITRAKHSLILSGEPVLVDDNEAVDFFTELSAYVAPVVYESPAAQPAGLDMRDDNKLPHWLQGSDGKEVPQIKVFTYRPDLIYLNAYSLATHDKCERLFYYSDRQLSTEPVFSDTDDDDTIPEYLIGNVVHELIYQDFYSPIPEDRLDGVISSLLPERYRRIISDADTMRIKNMFSNYRSIKTEPERVFVEYPIGMILHNGNYRVVVNVRLDRLEIYPSEAVVVDYKTTSHMDEAKKSEMREQLAIYMMVLSGRIKSGIPGKKLKGKIHLLDSGKTEQIDAYEDIGSVRSRLLALADKVYTHHGDKDNFPKTDDWGKCKKCPYNVRCGRTG